ncbi:hypothetical protein QE152_g13312 [Popillia japonica]|uniref:Uncharacterized protein n=1 Tax=Popillia japonica TaxID=7064 RepID=A0AAW1LEJ4_POPJA
MLINDIDNKITEENVRAGLIANLEPRNKLEISFKIDLLMRYRMYEKILEILQFSKNSLYISNILKNWTFFKDTFKNVTPNELVNDILPNLSYSTRMKVLNRISKNLFDQKLADRYFESVEKKYGIISASIMLASCSIGLIKEKMEKYNLVLSFKQVEALLKKDITFLDYYLVRTNSSLKANTCDKRKLLKTVYKRDEKLFWELCERHKIVSYCGKRLTKKIIKEHRHFLIDKRDEYPVHLKSRIMYQEWKRNPELFKSFIKNNSPEDIDWYFLSNRRPYYSSIFTEFDRYISKSRQYQFLNYAFQERFGCNIHDKLELITENILLLMPEELRNKILEIKVPENEDFLSICRPEIAFKALLDKIRHSSDMNKRVKYVDMLLLNCVHHSNADYLLKMLQYVEKRHRNDTQTLKSVFKGLQKWENLETLSVGHWTYIDAIEKLLILQKEFTNEVYFLSKRIGHLLNNNLDIGEHMRKYVDLLRRDIYSNRIFTEIPQHTKYCILELKKYIDEIKDKSEYEDFMLRYLRYIDQYNLSHPEDKIPASHVIPLLKSFCTEYPYQIQSLLVFYLQFSYDDLNPVIWQHPTVLFQYESLFNWYLRHHKDEMLDKFNSLVPILSIRTNRMFIQKLDEYYYRNLPEIITSFCVNQITQADEIRSKINALNILAVINQDEFLKITAEFEPSEDGKIDPSYPPEDIELLEAALGNIKKLLCPADGLNIVAKFCKGDYLKYALLPIYSTLLRVPERKATAFLTELHNSAVSVRKHTIHISKIIYGVDEFCSFIKEQAVAEKNPSLKTILFKKSLEYAHIMPTEKSWELVKVTMHGIDEDDVESHDLLLEIGKIPQQYRALYIPEVYTQLNSNKNLTINQKKYELIRLVPKNVVDELNLELLQIFLSEVIFNKQVRCSDAWTNLIFYSCGLKQVALVRINPNKSIKDKKDIFLSPLCEGILKYRLNPPLVQKLAKVWFNSFNPDIDVEGNYRLNPPLVQKLAKVWFNSFNPDIDVEGNIYLSCIIAYAECDYNFEKLPSKVNELLQGFLETYNGYLLDIFEKPLISFIQTVSHERQIQFIKMFLEGFPSVPVYLVSVGLLTSSFDIPNQVMEDYIALVRKIKDRPERCIRVHLYNNLPSKYEWLLQ